MTNLEKMTYTYKVAQQALESGEMPISAVIFLDDQVISQTYTSEKSDGKFLVHAELKALQMAERDSPSFKERRRMQLFTTLEPCMMCLGAAVSFFIGEIHYALEAPSDGAVSLLDLIPASKTFIHNYRPVIYKGLLANDCLELFKKYQKISTNKAMVAFAEDIIKTELN